jgi:hypothetical protein
MIIAQPVPRTVEDLQQEVTEDRLLSLLEKQQEEKVPSSIFT